MPKTKDYAAKRSFTKTPEPQPAVPGNVDPGTARPGDTFMIHQHHATRLHFDLRLKMFNGKTPVLVSWAVPKNLPQKKGRPHLAVHVEDHPFEYGSFSGTIPEGNYGAGEVRIFDSGGFEVLEQEPGKLTFRLDGERNQGIWHLFKPDGKKSGKDDWLVIIKEQHRPDPEPLPPPQPMMATLVDEPFDDERWIFEPKWDGIRALGFCEDETVLLSRNQRDITAAYPELQRLHERLVCFDAVVDGEIVAMEEGRPSFELLQQRMNLQDPKSIERATKTIPVTYLAFDLLYLDGKNVTRLPVEERRSMLEELVVPYDRVQVSSSVEGEGVALFEAAAAARLEGIVAKKLGSSYRPGKRSKDWLKVKTKREVELVVGGWTRGEGSRSRSFGALLVGAYEGSDLRYVGSVGTGYPEKILDELSGRLEQLEVDECPFAEDPTGERNRFGKVIKGPRWVRPELVARVEFRELTSGIRLRAPSFKGLRDDKPPEDCTVDELKKLAGVG